MAGKLKITQVKSQIARKPKQRATLVALGLGRIGDSRQYADNEQVRGMAAAVAHLVKIEEV